MPAWPPQPIRSIGLGLDLGDAIDFDGMLGGFQLAGAGRRTVSFIIDFFVVFGIPSMLESSTSGWLNGTCSVHTDAYGQATDCLSTWSFPWSLLVPGNSTYFLLVLIFIIVNVGYLNGMTGQSIGKVVTRTHLAMPVEQPDGTRCFVYVGFYRSIGRYIAHVLDVWTLGFGFLRGAWHPRRQTFADSAMGTVVVNTPITLMNGGGRKI